MRRAAADGPTAELVLARELSVSLLEGGQRVSVSSATAEHTQPAVVCVDSRIMELLWEFRSPTRAARRDLASRRAEIDELRSAGVLVPADVAASRRDGSADLTLALLDAIDDNVSSSAPAFERADGIVVSLPKSGRTWLRYMVNQYYHLAEGWEVNMQWDAVIGETLPRVIFTHDRWEHYQRVESPSSAEFLAGYYLIPRGVRRTRKLLLLVRDLRDVVVSYFFQLSRRERRQDAPESIAELARHPRLGLPAMVHRLNAWYREWGGSENLKLVRYEDFQDDCEGQFAAVLRFFGIAEIDRAALVESVRRSSFANMQLAESSRRYGLTLSPIDPDDPDSRKVRRGKVGGFRDHFGDEDLRFAEHALRDLHPAFGYS